MLSRHVIQFKLWFSEGSFQIEYLALVYVQILWMEFVKLRQSLELNFSHLKKEIEGFNLKMDELKQLLLEVSDMFTMFIFSNT